MSRPSSNTDAKLLKAGRDLLPLTGVSGMNIRQIAKKAGVNMGMFHYHFKTKEVFARRVMQEYYEEMFAILESQAMSTGTPLERLRGVVCAFGRFVRDNRAVLLGMFRDLALGEQVTIDFLRANMHRHVELIMVLTAQAQAARQIGPFAPINALLMLMSAANLPSIIVEVGSRVNPPERIAPLAALFQSQVLTDEAIEARVDAILIGLVVQRDDLPPEDADAPAPAAEPETRGTAVPIPNAD